MFYHFQFY